MAFFRMTNPGNVGFKKALNACQMSLGCIVEIMSDCINIATFEKGDKELIIDTIGEFGSVFVTDLAMN